jgi:hypothetical protein
MAALVAIALAASKAFRDRNTVVDLRHAVRRLTEVKARYAMTNAELERYMRTAVDQPGLFRAGFPFGAALSPGRVEPWLEKHRRRKQVILEPSPRVPESELLSVSELARRGCAFLGSFAKLPLSSSLSNK